MFQKKYSALFLSLLLCWSVSSQAKKAPPQPSTAPANTTVKDNKVEPISNEQELQDRAKGLFEAIVKDDPTLAEDFWFPKEPFIPIKNFKTAEGYWKKLHKAYGEDIHELHKLRSSWEGTSFVRYELGDQKWVKPGLEHNAIGYYRTMYSKIVYNTPKGEKSFKISVAITWQGRWYVVHLTRTKI